MDDTYSVADPFLVGDGPVTFSTSLGLAKRYPHIWDVNSYYRDLGISYFATKQEIRKAYQRKKGWRSRRLTYIVKQLLNPTIRAAYDATGYGEIFWDRYVERMIRRAATKEAARLRREGKWVEAEEMGKYDSPFSDPVGYVSPPDYPAESWPWAYYLWQSNCQDIDRLRRWQEALIEALGGQPHELAVGFCGELSWAVQRVGFRTVAFLGDGAEPSKGRAAKAADQITEQRRSIG